MKNVCLKLEGHVCASCLVKIFLNLIVRKSFQMVSESVLWIHASYAYLKYHSHECRGICNQHLMRSMEE